MPSILERGEERQNILNILQGAKKALKTDDVLLLKDMSNRTIHNASIYKDPDSVTIAVTIYALSKIVERKKYTQYREWPAFFSRIALDIDKAIDASEERKIKEFHDALQNIRNAVNALSGHLKLYIQDVFRRAQINKASRLYEHGISRAETAKLLDITEWELAEYVGRTGIADANLSITMPIKARLKLARALFE